MVIGPITEAHVEIDADVTEADAAIDGLDVRLEAVEKIAEQVGEQIEEVFREAFRSIVRDIDIATDRIEREFQETGAEVDAVLASIGGPELFAAVSASAEVAGEEVQDSFQEAARQSDAALNDIGGANAFGPVVAESKVAGEAVEQSFRRSSAGIDRALADASTSSTRHFGAIRTAALVAVAGVGLLSAGITAFGVVGAARLEQTQIGFEALLGSAEEAQAFIEEMQQFAARTPFEFQGLANNTRQLLAIADAAGITRDELIPTIETIGDLTAVLGAPADSIDRVVRALGQMASRGKVSTQELLQLSEALPGFAPFQALADGLGITTEELQRLVESGAIPAQQGIDLLLQGMAEFPGAAGAMAKQAQTLTGVFSTFKDTIQIALTDAFQPLVPTIKTALADAIPVVEETLGTLAPALSTLAGGLITTLVDIFDAVGPSFGVALQGLANGFNSIFESMATVVGDFRPVLESLAPLFDILGEVLQPVIGVIATAVATVLPPFLNLLTNVLTALEPVIDVVGEALTGLIESLGPFFSQIGLSLVFVLDAALPLLEGLADLFGRVLETVEPLIVPFNHFVAILAGGLIDAINILGPALEDVGNVFLDAFTEIIDSIGPDLPELARAFASIAISLAEILAALTPLLVPLLQLASILVRISFTTNGALIQGFAFLLGVVADIATFIRENAGPAFQTFLDVMTSLWTDVLEPFAGFLASTFIAAIVGTAEILSSGLQVALDAVTTAADFLWNGVLVPLGNFLATVLQPVIVAIGIIALGPLAVAITAVSIAANALWNFVLVPFGNFLAAVFTPIINALSVVLVSVFTVAVAGVTTAASFLWNSVLVPLGGFLSAAFSAAVGVARFAFDLLRGSVELVAGAVTSAIDVAFDPIKSLLETGLSFAIGVATTAFGLLQDSVGLVATAIEGLIGWIEDAIGFVDRLIDRIESIPGGGVVGDIVGAIPGVGAEGGIFDRATNMIIGEAGREVLLPLTDPARTLALANASGLWDVLARAQGGAAAAPSSSGQSALGGGGGGATVEIRNYFAPGTTSADADRISSRVAGQVADVLDGRAARVEAKIA